MLLTRTSERQGRRDRPRRGRLDGEEEAGGLLLMTRPRRRSPRTSSAYLEAHERKGLLRFITCGSVDDGKSTLIGRLLYESQAALRGPARRARGGLEDASARRASELDFALLVDGLAAEREQGITIDVAYRYFSTEQRKFIVADTPGPRAVHPQHGHRRLDRRLRGHPDRRAQGRADPDPPAQLPRLAARHPPRRRWRSTRWTWSTTREERFREIEARVPRVRRRSSGSRTSRCIPLSGAARRQRRRAERRACRGTAGRR